MRRQFTLEITESGADRIQELCHRLGIDEPRDLIDRAVKALEILSKTADDQDNEVEVRSKSGRKSASVRFK